MGPAGRRTRRTRRARSRSSARTSPATSPKFEVIDGQGVEWKVKLGPESQPETAATRFLWAAGYFVDEDYYVAELTVKGLPTLQRGQEFVSPGGIVHGARLERKRTTVKKLGDWDWFDNPFRRTAGTERPARDDVAPEQLGPEAGQQLHLRRGRRAPLRGQRRRRHVREDGQRDARDPRAMPEDYEHSKFIAKVDAGVHRLRAPQPPLLPVGVRGHQLPSNAPGWRRSPSTSRVPTRDGWGSGCRR